MGSDVWEVTWEVTCVCVPVSRCGWLNSVSSCRRRLDGDATARRRGKREVKAVVENTTVALLSADNEVVTRFCDTFRERARPRRARTCGYTNSVRHPSPARPVHTTRRTSPPWSARGGGEVSVGTGVAAGE